MLVRPWPSLRILFTSAALRIPGLAQSRLLDRIGGPHSVREGIAAAFAEGARVTAKVYWLTGNVNGSHSNRSSARISGPAGLPQQSFHARSNSIEGKPRYIHCTPLHGADGAPGVWMVVMVEKEDITGTINNGNSQNGRARRSSFGILNGTYAQEKLFEQQQQVQQQYRLLRQSASGAGGECIIDGGASGTGYSSRRRTRTSSTFFDDDERSIPASSSAYAEYLASGGGGGGGGVLRSGSVSRGPSRPPSRAASMPGWAAAAASSRPEQPTRKMTPREETARMVRLPMQTERLGEVDES